jgi:hypothetical protein
VAYDLETSPFECEVYYTEIRYLIFKFSSQLYLDKFKEKIEDNRNKINDSLSNRFGFTIKNDVLADIKLYSSIEKRGFLIKGKEEYKCLNNIILNGVNLIQPN